MDEHVRNKAVCGQMLRADIVGLLYMPGDINPASTHAVIDMQTQAPGDRLP